MSPYSDSSQRLSEQTVVLIYLDEANVYTDPLANPQRNPNIDSKRTEPLTVVEIKVIKEILKKLKEK